MWSWCKTKWVDISLCLKMFTNYWWFNTAVIANDKKLPLPWKSALAMINGKMTAVTPFEGSVQGRKHPGSCVFAELDLLGYRTPKHEVVVQNEKNVHENPYNSHSYCDENHDGKELYQNIRKIVFRTNKPSPPPPPPPPTPTLVFNLEMYVTYILVEMAINYP